MCLNLIVALREKVNLKNRYLLILCNFILSMIPTKYGDHLIRVIDQWDKLYAKFLDFGVPKEIIDGFYHKNKKSLIALAQTGERGYYVSIYQVTTIATHMFRNVKDRGIISVRKLAILDLILDNMFEITNSVKDKINYHLHN